MGAPLEVLAGLAPVGHDTMRKNLLLLGVALVLAAPALAQPGSGPHAFIQIPGGSGPLPGADACDDGAASFTIVLNTGVDATGAPLTPGLPDPRWTSTSPVPSATYTHPVFSGWTSDPAADWINTNPASADSIQPGETVYQLQYQVPPQAVHATLTGKFAADNTGVAADTDPPSDPNGVSYLLGSTAADYGFSSFTPFSERDDLATGVHTLTVDVKDFGGATGVIVVAQVHGGCAPVNITPCDASQGVHVYTESPPAGNILDVEGNPGAGGEQAGDGCLLPGDGDPETGQNGGSFPAGPCVPPGSVAHHGYAAGTPYWANNLLGRPVAWIAATDGAVPGLGFECVGNDIFSNDPTTDSNDCATGPMGFYAGGSPPTVPALIGANEPGNPCVPADGFVNVILISGPVVVDPCGKDNGGGVQVHVLNHNLEFYRADYLGGAGDPCKPRIFLSTPIQGQITDGGPLP